MKIVPNFGSEKITADWGVTGSAYGNGEIEFTDDNLSPRKTGPIEVFSPFANAEEQPSKDDLLDGRTLGDLSDLRVLEGTPVDYTSLTLNNFNFHFDEMKVTFLINVETTGLLGRIIPDTDYFELVSINFASFIGNPTIGQHEDTDGLTAYFTIGDPDPPNVGEFPDQIMEPDPPSPILIDITKMKADEFKKLPVKELATIDSKDIEKIEDPNLKKMINEKMIQKATDYVKQAPSKIKQQASPGMIFEEDPILSSTVRILLPPNLQIRNGVSPDDVVCNEGLELIKRATNGKPVCVLESTAELLLERGWAVP